MTFNDRQFCLDATALATGDRARRKPLRTFKELAEEFGTTPNRLQIAMGRSSTPPPKPALIHRGKAVSTTNSWYHPDEMRAWWAAYQLESKSSTVVDTTMSAKQYMEKYRTPL